MTHYTLETLSQLNEGFEQPARFAVIGNPVAHSLSPQLHQPALDALKLNSRYIRVEVPEGKVRTAFTQMHELGIEGVNVTVPHKLEALEACDEVSEAAQKMGAVNTIVFSDEKLLGFNTDGPGFVRAIREDFSMDLGDLRVAIIGAGGGAGRAIATQCTLAGCPQLILANRTLAKLERMKSELAYDNEKLQGPGDPIQIYALEDPHLHEAIAQSELIINTTSIGLKQHDPAPIPANWIEPHHLVYDTIYNPSRTRLLKNATSRGARIANGLSLLLHQGALSLEYWLGREAPIDAMRQGLKQI